MTTSIKLGISGLRDIHVKVTHNTCYLLALGELTTQERKKKTTGPLARSRLPVTLTPSIISVYYPWGKYQKRKAERMGGQAGRDGL